MTRCCVNRTALDTYTAAAAAVVPGQWSIIHFILEYLYYVLRSAAVEGLLILQQQQQQYHM